MICAKDVARELGVSERSARRLMATRKLAAMKVGKLWRTEPAHVETYKTGEYERYRRERS